jgi:hypothetical protein
VGVSGPARGLTPTCPEGQVLLSRIQGTGETLTLIGATPEQVAAWAAAVRAGGRGRLAVAPGPQALDAAAFARLVEAGVDELRVRLYAVDAAAHDYHAGVEGSARATVAMLRAARAAGLRALVTTPVTRANVRVLAGVPGLLADVAAAGWRVLVPAAAGADGPGPGASGSAHEGREPARPGPAVGPPPRLAIVAPYALQAIAAAERAGIPAGIEGLPLCLLGPLRDRGLPLPARTYGSACGACPARAGCPGVDAGYLEHFGGAELSPRALSPAGGAGRRGERLGDMFSGPWIETGTDGCWPI